MGNKEKKPWSFGLFGGKNGTKSILAFFVFLILAIVTHVAGAVYGEITDRRERPVLALKSVLRDVREFVRVEKKVPANFREIEIKIWNKSKPDAPSRLHGNNILLTDNYEYIYHSGNVQGVPLVNVWAIPQGKYRDQYETVLIVITPDAEEVWRGPAFNDAQREFVLSPKGFNPTFPDMAAINMKRDAKAPAQQQKKKFGIF